MQQWYPNQDHRLILGKEVFKPAPPTTDKVAGKGNKTSTSTYAQIVGRKAQPLAQKMEKTTPPRASKTSSTTPTTAARWPLSAAAADEAPVTNATMVTSVVTNIGKKVQQKGNPPDWTLCSQGQSGDCGDTAPEECLGRSPRAQGQ